MAEAFSSDGRDAALAVGVGCGVTQGLELAPDGRIATFARACVDQLGVQDRVIGDVDPDVVLVIGQADAYRRQLGDGSTVDPAVAPAKALALLDRAVDRLSVDGAVVAFTLPADNVFIGADNERLDRYRDLLRQLARSRDDVVLVDLQALICPGGRCTQRLDGVELRPDGLHFSKESAALVAPLIEARTLAAVSVR